MFVKSTLQHCSESFECWSFDPFTEFQVHTSDKKHFISLFLSTKCLYHQNDSKEPPGALNTAFQGFQADNTLYSSQFIDEIIIVMLSHFQYTW